MSKDIAIESLGKKIDELNQQVWDLRVYDYAKAFVISQESLQLARSINYQKGIADAACLQGFLFARVSKNDEAWPLLEESLAIYKSLGDKEGQAISLDYMGIVQRNWGNFGASLELLFNALDLSEGKNLKDNEIANIYYQLGVTYKNLGNFEKALDFLYKSRAGHQAEKTRLYESYPINIIGTIYFENGDYNRALEFFKEALNSRQELNDKLGIAGSLDNIGYAYFKLKDYSQAINFCSNSLDISRQTGDKRSQANSLHHLAEIYKESGDRQKAVACCNESLQIRKETGDIKGEAQILLFLAELYKDEEGDKVLERLHGALKIAEEIKGLDLLSRIRLLLFEYYKGIGNYDKAIQNLELHLALDKEFHKNTIEQKVANLEITHKAEEARKETEAIRLKNEELTKLNTEIERQRLELEQALSELQSTQAQLIQSEKMASLGELTAGIAHEIQNPLNFVNNFSDVSNELLIEMEAELKNGNFEEANALLSDVKQNLEKILHHGKRADGIVKGMLQHSRTGTGQTELTDINVLCDEYLRLAFHGLRAKDKSFSAKFETDFDNSIEKINIVRQDVGRVILNLINNAFYAANDKAKHHPGNEPVVTISTNKVDGKVEIKVKDNGNGIPRKILDKIFQPFFTTKPTGQGTGLGLSLSYDIIKAHGGEIRVETKENEGSEFIIQLPI